MTVAAEIRLIVWDHAQERISGKCNHKVSAGKPDNRRERSSCQSVTHARTHGKVASEARGDVHAKHSHLAIPVLEEAR
jgi:hypothetical protein